MNFENIFQIIEINVENKKLDDLKILHLSDLHINKKTSNENIIITSPINNLNYSIILYGKNRCKKIITQRVV